MDTNNSSLIISICALIVSTLAVFISTVLAIFKIIEFFNHEKKSFKLTSTIGKPYDKIDVSVVNIGQRPITLDSFKVRIGFDTRSNIVLLSKPLEIRKKLEDTESYQFSILRDDILNAINNKNIKQGYFQRLFVEIKLSTDQKIIAPVFIDLDIIKVENLNFDCIRGAKPYIATDIFMGFSPMQPIIHYTRNNY